MSNVNGRSNTPPHHHHHLPPLKMYIQLKSNLMSRMPFRFLCVARFGFSSCFGTCECFPGTDSKTSRNRVACVGRGEVGGEGDRSL